MTNDKIQMTNESSKPNDKLLTPVQYLKGVGPQVAKLLQNLGIKTVLDLLYFVPRDYEDRSQMKPIAKLEPTNFAVVKGEIVSIHNQITKGRFSVLKVLLGDRSGYLEAVWFNQPYLLKLFRKGMKLIASGRLEMSAFSGTMQLTVKEFEVDTGEALKFVPKYPLTQGLYPKKLREIVKVAVKCYLTDVVDALPLDVRAKYELVDLKQALQNIHFPTNLAKVRPALKRLVFDDFFYFQLGLLLRQKKVKKQPGIAFIIDEEKLANFLDSLPFQLTVAQKRVWQEILADMKRAQPMNRLLQGDVGSGKTIVAILAALVAIQNGYQVAIMAPTEILAQQHGEKVAGFLRDQGIKVKLLTGTTQRKEKTQELADWDLIIGTHALIEAGVQFKKLGLAVIDEQHRFGVLQRAKLKQKGLNPDIIFMTATPIPRSLALTLYGDLDRSVIDEMPPGRTPIKTNFVPQAKRKSCYSFIRQEIEKGRQVFVVCPLVEESEKLDLKAALDEAERLQQEIFSDLKVGLVHGRMKGEEKDQIMGEFRSGKINILVSTTVIEVGIDIPNASVMVVEHAERFGLSQLHQLRGRIGRGAAQSYCFLFGDPKTADAKERIKAMVESHDGFHIAEVDLRLRGPGDFLGVRQSGLPEFKVADIIRDEEILRLARQAAEEVIKGDPALRKEGNLGLKEIIMAKHKKFLGY